MSIIDEAKIVNDTAIVKHAGSVYHNKTPPQKSMVDMYAYPVMTLYQCKLVAVRDPQAGYCVLHSNYALCLISREQNITSLPSMWSKALLDCYR